MKYLKIHIDKGPDGFIYPLGYQEEIGNFSKDHLYFEENGEQKLILVIDDKDFNNKMIRKDVEEITKDDVIAVSEANETREEIVKDEVKLRRIELKATLKQPLSADELKSVDVDDKDSLFTKNKILADRI